MKFTKNFLAVVLTVLGLASCSQFKTEVTETGLKYKFITQNEGRKPKLNDLITFHMKIESATDSVIQNTYKQGSPMKIQYMPGQFKGSIEEGLAMMTKGDSAIFYVSADSLFARAMQELPTFVKTGSDLKFTVKMIEIQSLDEYKAGLMKKQANEGADMAAYVSKNLPNAAKTASGISYLITKAGTGATVTKGDTVVVKYKGQTTAGKIFDQGSFPLIAGMGMVIPGWDEMLVGMQLAEKRTVVIPSSLGYGEQGSQGAIEPFTTLVFDMEIEKIGKPKGSAKK